MKEKNYINLPELNDEVIEYLEKGLFNIVKTANCASIEAFPSEILNKRGVFLDKKTFTTVIETFEIDINLNLIPDYFLFTIRESPISLFKRWIFQISDKPYLSIAQRSQAVVRDFFSLFIKDQLYMVPITTNIAHERFLFNVYTRKKLEEYTMSINTYFVNGKSLVIYKDYVKKKISVLKLKRSVISNKLYPIRITVRREANRIRFNVVVAHRYTYEHMIKFKKPTRTSKTEQAFIENKKMARDNEKKVLAIIKEHHNRSMETNNYANVSLGRVARIPILITLPNRKENSNIKIKVVFSEKDRLLTIFNKDDQVLKTVTTCIPPKSNWLKRYR